jgi:hypothetical protein
MSASRLLRSSPTFGDKMKKWSWFIGGLGGAAECYSDSFHNEMSYEYVPYFVVAAFVGKGLSWAHWSLPFALWIHPVLKIEEKINRPEIFVAKKLLKACGLRNY